jgi:hypothetical protein
MVPLRTHLNAWLSHGALFFSHTFFSSFPEPPGYPSVTETQNSHSVVISVSVSNHGFPPNAPQCVAFTRSSIFFTYIFFLSSYIFFFFGWAESYPVLSYLVLSFPIRSDLVLSGPILSFPKRGPMFRLSPIPAIFERLNPVRPVRLHLSPAFRKPLGTYHLLSPSAPGKRGCNADFQPFTLVS